MQNYYYYYLYFGNDKEIIPVLIDKDGEWERIKTKLESKAILEKLKVLTKELI